MKEIMENWRKTADQFNETTLSRIQRKIDPNLIQDPEDRSKSVPFVVISADRHNYSRSQNDTRYSELQQMTKVSGFPFAQLGGGWVEQDEAGNKIKVEEKSVIIYDEERGDVERTGVQLKELAKELCNKYEQEAFIFGEPGRDTGAMYINAYKSDGTRADYGGPWSTVEEISMDDADFWSRVRGTGFQFKESQEEIVEIDAPNSVIGAMIKANEHKGKKIKFVRK